MKRAVVASLLILESAGLALAADRPSLAQVENRERQVDEVAISSQDKAISKLSALLKKYRATSQEPILLIKLAELQAQYSSIAFRIAHGTAHANRKKIDLTRTNRALQESISTLNTLIDRYPSYIEIAHAYYMRGKSYEELQKKDLARRDYLHLVNHFPDADDSPAAYMSLAEFAIEANQHAAAIPFLKAVEKLPDDSHHPFALYKLAWAYYNLKDVPKALAYAERHVSYYSTAAKKPEAGLATSETAMRENTLLDVAVFYFEGYEQKEPRYALENALEYFKKLEPGQTLGKMAYRFSKLLRSHGHEAALVAWKDQIVSEQSQLPESLEVLLTTFEYLANKSKYDQLISSSQELVQLHEKHPEFPSFVKAQKLLLESAENLQNLIVKNKNHEMIPKLNRTLVAYYDSFTRLVDERDPRIQMAHFNLAETLFATRDFSGATQHYRWIVEHGKWPETAKASLMAISSRYETLKLEGKILKVLVAHSFDESSHHKMERNEQEWVDWIDTHAKKAPDDAHSSEFENFVFEANRTLYARGQTVSAVERLIDFAKERSQSANALPSASLALDTYVRSKDWKRSHELATEFLAIAGWEKNPAFFNTSAESFFHLIEAENTAKEYKKVLRDCERFEEKYNAHSRRADALLIAGTAARLIGDRDRAIKNFSGLIALPGQPSVALREGLLSRSLLAEERYDFSGAAKDLRAYLELPSSLVKLEDSRAIELKKKTLLLSWLAASAGETGVLESSLKSPALCGGEAKSLTSECGQFSAWLSLLSLKMNSHSKTVDPDDLAEKVKESKDGSQPIWGALALTQVEKLSFRQRLAAIRAVSKHWDEISPLMRYSLMPLVSRSIPRAFELNREEMPKLAPLRANAKHITHRVEAIREIENTATSAMKLPIARVRALALNEMASLYLQLSRELGGMPAPKNLSSEDLASYEDTVRKLLLPFEEKGVEMRAKAFELATEFSLDPPAWNSIATLFIAENPSVAKKRQLASIQKQNTSYAPLGVDWLNEIGLNGSTRDLVYSHWLKALSAQHWAHVAFFLQEAEVKKTAPAGILSAWKAVSLATAGAQSESQFELEAAQKELMGKQRVEVLLSLAKNALQTQARDRARKYLDQMSDKERLELSRDEERWVASLKLQ